MKKKISILIITLSTIILLELLRQIIASLIPITAPPKKVDLKKFAPCEEQIDVSKIPPTHNDYMELREKYHNYQRYYFPDKEDVVGMRATYNDKSHADSEELRFVNIDSPNYVVYKFLPEKKTYEFVTSTVKYTPKKNRYFCRYDQNGKYINAVVEYSKIGLLIGYDENGGMESITDIRGY